ncbi:hypothetical protein CEXT_434901 [Caerostris extrusa]|uniref:LAGLIDADG homing endonuclease n=1 Tax=Caerostris extrusa TaxID=172846 RepID=A0AAV4UCZ8_CAEEX|nr:hypothetical protein CEXT_434901 [Caerostris extrusa]
MARSGFGLLLFKKQLTVNSAKGILVTKDGVEVTVEITRKEYVHNLIEKLHSINRNGNRYGPTKQPPMMSFHVFMAKLFLYLIGTYNVNCTFGDENNAKTKPEEQGCKKTLEKSRLDLSMTVLMLVVKRFFTSLEHTTLESADSHLERCTD